MGLIINAPLPKWPALLVAGKPVTPDQAKEILIRTDSFHFSTNNAHWRRRLFEAVGIEYRDESPFYDNNALEEAKRKYGVLDLEYLCNSRIASCWIGGPHGWCNWDGTIFTNTYNIGKWPSVQRVFDEWALIAKTFPYLTLTSQLLSGEVGEEGVYPVVEFVIENGEVTCRPPKTMIAAPDGDAMFRLFESAWNVNTGERAGERAGERGCTMSTFKQALVIAEARQQ